MDDTIKVSRFGQFLCNKGLVSEADIALALAKQQSLHVQLGQLAIKHRYLTVQDVMQVFRNQAGTDEYFAETAVRLGLLDQPTLDELIALQCETRPKIGTILVDMGRIEADQLELLLEEYHHYLESKGLNKVAAAN